MTPYAKPDAPARDARGAAITLTGIARLNDGFFEIEARDGKGGKQWYLPSLLYPPQGPIEYTLNVAIWRGATFGVC